jgi:hypothetical protein
MPEKESDMPTSQNQPKETQEQENLRLLNKGIFGPLFPSNPLRKEDLQKQPATQ